MNDDRIVLVSPATGAVPLATRLHTHPPDLASLVSILADVARGLSALHAHDRGFLHLCPEQVLVTVGPHGRDVASLNALWWSWTHGFDPTPADPWRCPEPGGHASARDAWALGALGWHALTGAPPPPAHEDPRLRTHLPSTTPGALATLIRDLLHRPLSTESIDLTGPARELDRIARKIASTSGPNIAPPMLLGTPVPVGGQLRPNPDVLPSPPPDAYAPRPASPPSAPQGLQPTAHPTPHSPAHEVPLFTDEELRKAASDARRTHRLRDGMLLATAAVLVLIIALLSAYIAGLLG